MPGTASELVDEIERAVRRGELRPGDRLPTVRALAEERAVSATTVSAAYRRLRERGVVVGRARQGTLVAPRPATRSGLGGRAPVAGVDAATGTPALDLLPDLAELLRGLDRGQVSYGDPMIDPRFADAAAAWLRADGVDASCLTVTSGAMDAIERVIDAWGLRVGDQVAVEDPGHVPVHQLARSHGLQLIPVSVDDEGPEIDSLRDAIHRGARAVIVTPRAQNPTGAAITAGRAAELRTVLADSPSVSTVVDDHAGAVAGPALELASVPSRRWAVVRSFAKSYGPDLRIAVVAGDEPTVAAVEARYANGPGWVSHLLQRLAASLLSSESAAEMVRDAAGVYAGRRGRLIGALAASGIEARGRSGLNVWIPVVDEQHVVDAVRRAGIEVRAGAPYRIRSAPAVRVTTASLDDELVDRVAAAVAGAVRVRRTTPV